MQNHNKQFGNRSHRFGNFALALSVIGISLLLFSLISYVSLVLRSMSILASVVEHNGVIGMLRLQAFASLAPIALSIVAFKLGASRRLATACMIVSLLCGLGYLLLEQFIRSLF